MMENPWAIAQSTDGKSPRRQSSLCGSRSSSAPMGRWTDASRFRMWLSIRDMHSDF
jgi:hypothetical protein